MREMVFFHKTQEQAVAKKSALGMPAQHVSSVPEQDNRAFHTQLVGRTHVWSDAIHH
jgi:hypothetical protein